MSGDAVAAAGGAAGVVGSEAYSEASEVAVYRTVNRRLVEMVDLDDRALVLDVGCGPGLVPELVRELRPGVRAVWGIDNDPVMVAEARRRLGGRAGVVRADVAEVPALFPAGTIDAAFLANCVHILDDPVAALGSLAAVVAPGGQVALNTAFFAGAASEEDRLVYLRLLLTARRLAARRGYAAGADRPRRGHAARRSLTVDYLVEALAATGFAATAVEQHRVTVPGEFLYWLASTPMFAAGVLPGLEPTVAAAIMQEAMATFAEGYYAGSGPSGIERTWLYIVGRRRRA